MKQGPCAYGGFDNIAKCSGGTEDNMCTDLIIDSSREHIFIADLKYYENEMATLPKDSPRYKALKSEVDGYRKVLSIINDKKDAKYD